MTIGGPYTVLYAGQFEATVLDQNRQPVGDVFVGRNAGRSAETLCDLLNAAHESGRLTARTARI